MRSTHRFGAVLLAVVLSALLVTATAMAGLSNPYDPVPDADTGLANAGLSIIRECAGVNIDGTPTILFSSESLMYYAPSFGANTNIILPAGTTYRLLSTLEVTQTDAISGETETFTWYEIDGPCPAGSGMTLWFPEGTPFSVIAQN
jgi:hypothetical protein